VRNYTDGAKMTVEEKLGDDESLPSLWPVATLGSSFRTAVHWRKKHNNY
jgi:hypothetical protein